MRLGIYARISDDTEGTGLGVERQIEDCQHVTRARRASSTELYVDNDVSAYSRRVTRPRFEAMLSDLGTKLDGIVVYNLDRLARQPRDLERVIDIYDDHPKLLFATVEGDINLATPDGRTMARVMVAFANKASADTGRRTKRKHLELAKLGKPVGGYRPFGWREDKATLHPEESAVMRGVIEDVIAGKTIRSVTYGLNERGYKTTAGNTWSFQTLRNYLRNPRLVGWRTHQRKVLLDEHGDPVQGLWEPLVGEDTWDRLQEALRRRQSAQGWGRPARPNARIYLLTGLARCGHSGCNAVMHGSAQPNGRFIYACGAGSYNGHSNSISGLPLDGFVRDVVAASLAGEATSAVPQAEWSGQAELERLDAQLEAVLDRAMSASGSMQQKLWARAEALGQEKDRMHQDRARWIAETTGPVVGTVTPEMFERLEEDQIRAIIEERVQAIVVTPARRRGGPLDWSRVRVIPVERG